MADEQTNGQGEQAGSDWNIRTESIETEFMVSRIVGNDVVGYRELMRFYIPDGMPPKEAAMQYAKKRDALEKRVGDVATRAAGAHLDRLEKEAQSEIGGNG